MGRNKVSGVLNTDDGSNWRIEKFPLDLAMSSLETLTDAILVEWSGPKP